MEINKIYNEDCLEGMKRIPDKSIDLILCDPPYGIDYQSQRKKDKSKRMPRIMNDKKPFLEFIPQIKRITKKSGGGFLFTRWDCQQKFIDELTKNDLKVRNVIIWDKVAHGMGNLKSAYGSRYESIIFYSNNDFRFPNKRPTDIIRVQRVSPNKLIHPNEKPVELLEILLKQTTNEGALVLDNCIGSGTTAVACINTNRNYIGFEMDKHYYEVAVDRVEKALREVNE